METLIKCICLVQVQFYKTLRLKKIIQWKQKLIDSQMLKFLGDKYRIGLKKMSKDNSKITKNRNKKNKTLSSSSSSSSSSSNNNSSSNSR